MKHLLAFTLALCLVAATGLASAQGYRGPSYGQDAYTRYDYARVIRVDPVFDRYGSGYATSGSQRCYNRETHVRGDGYGEGYYRNDGYARRDEGYYDQYGNYRRSGSQAGATAATVVGGIVGAVIGSQVGGGSARYATSALGTMVGGMAGRQIYEQGQRERDRVGTVTVCDPVPSGSGYYGNDRTVDAYDVTYEYGGHQYTTRTHYHPGDRIRVRVDVRAE